MNLFKRALANHVLVNLTFVLVIAMGTLSYLQMPRSKDPEINFYWANISTPYPGAVAEDVEKNVTNPLEAALQGKINNIKFERSVSRHSISFITVRFDQVDDDTFEKRLTELQRAVQSAYTDTLPADAKEPIVSEINMASGFPDAMVVAVGTGDDENFRRQTRDIRKDLERIKGVGEVRYTGLTRPELHVVFDPGVLEGMEITPADISETIRAYFRDISVGNLETANGDWSILMRGGGLTCQYCGRFRSSPPKAWCRWARSPNSPAPE